MTDDVDAPVRGDRPWIKPSIVPLRSGLLNKFGNRDETAWTDAIDDVPIADLLEAHGSPLFVVSERRLRQNNMLQGVLVPQIRIHPLSVRPKN